MEVLESECTREIWYNSQQLKGLFEANGYELNVRPCSIAVFPMTIFNCKGTSIVSIVAGEFNLVSLRGVK